MHNTICTVSAALDRMKPTERARTLKIAALGIAKRLNRERLRTAKPLYSAEHYFALVWQHYHHGAGKDWKAQIEDSSDVVRLFVHYGGYFIMRDSRPKNRKAKGGKTREHKPLATVVSLDQVEKPPADESTPETLIETAERHRIERVLLETMLAERRRGSAADELLFLNFVRLLRTDGEALKDVGNFGLNAKYVAKKLGVSPGQASTLWQRFKSLCRATDSPTLRTLVEEIDSHWLRALPAAGQSERMHDDTSDAASEQARGRNEGLRS